MAISLAATGCGGSPKSGTATSSGAGATTETTTTTSQTARPSSSAADLRKLIPTPLGTQRTDGPDDIQDNGIHLHFLVNGSPTDVMGAYQTALQGMNWAVSVESSGGGGGGGGATYSGTNGSNYGLFDGGGYRGTTDLDVCVWPSKPSNTHCGGRGGHGSR
ncbi:hypothetical protein BST27_13625 [Mycobacterium intermedium]|uniref:Uncharacterized protein n=2 Tax=Mycobacterium intermedium TaxID=28445 RepID=A0A1E3SCN0_MYCIE|nr:hypothetical protein [Mycobacterium intermedium]ODQ99844.1 hypothetical protein BHQ20_15460 [Mycobacterium intermedium]OPE51880.1 hypothetical protein BV508_04765 [Mycobacterium intermedium]ORB05002.1 hypothetical protein BST27_13625 [Mycobacterium intermedium]